MPGMLPSESPWWWQRLPVAGVGFKAVSRKPGLLSKSFRGQKSIRRVIQGSASMRRRHFRVLVDRELSMLWLPEYLLALGLH